MNQHHSARLRNTLGLARPARRAGLHPVLATLPILAALIGGCGDTSSWVPTEATDPGTLFLSPNQVEMDNYTTQTLQLNVLHSDGRSAPATGSVLWTSSSPAVLQVSDRGVITARLPGVATVTAASTRGSASATVRVLPVNSDLRLVVNDSIEIPAGLEGGRLIETRIVDIAGNPVQGVEVDFAILSGEASVSPGKVFSDAQGFARATMVTGTTVGEVLAEVTSPGIAGPQSSAAQVGPGRGSAVLRAILRALIRPSHPSEVKLSPERSRMAPGESETFTAQVLDSYGNEIDDAEIGWSTSNPSVASVDDSGSVLALGSGEARLTAVASNRSGRTASGSLDIAVDASGLRLEIEAGDRQAGPVGTTLPTPLQVRVVRGDGAGVSGIAVQWTVVQGTGSLQSASPSTGSDGRASASVQLGQSVGPVRVRASAGSIGSAHFELEVLAGPLHAITVSPVVSELGVGSTRGFQAQGRDSFGNPVPAGALTWTSSNTSVATVNSSGLATARAAGTTTISARSGSVTGSASLTVVSGGTQTISIAPGSLALEVGHSQVVTAQVLDAAGKPVSGAQVTWSSSSSGIATVDGSGTVTAVAPGEATITAHSGGASGAIPVSVASTQDGGSTAPQSLHLSGASSLTSLGETLQLNVTARNAAGDVVDTPPVTWSSSNSSVATVNSSGRVTANAIGTAVISVMASCCSTDQVSVTVSQEVASVQVSPSSASLQVGQGQNFQAVARDARGNVVNNVSFAWSTTNASVVNVNGSGSASATGAGSAQVRASVAGHTGASSVSVASSGGNGPAPGGPPFLNDDFSGYASRSQLLNTSSNPWSTMNQHEAVTPGQFIFLETNPPAGATGGQTMRYWQEGTGASCTARRQDTGGGARRSVPGNARELWSEFRFYLSPNWTIAHSDCGGYNGYKFFFHDTVSPHTGQVGRVDLNLVGRGFESMYPGAGHFYAGNGQPGSDLSGLIGRWVTVRMYTALPTTPDSNPQSRDGSGDGAFRVWVDGVQIINASGLHSHMVHFHQVRLGANMNWTVRDHQDIHWDYIRTWDSNPGW